MTVVRQIDRSFAVSPPAAGEWMRRFWFESPVADSHTSGALGGLIDLPITSS